MFFVYVLYSDTAHKHYIGQTNDPERRLCEHNDPNRARTKFTAKYAGSWKLIHKEQFSTRSEAMAREKSFKTGVGREWIIKIKVVNAIDMLSANRLKNKPLRASVRISLPITPSTPTIPTSRQAEFRTTLQKPCAISGPGSV